MFSHTVYTGISRYFPLCEKDHRTTHVDTGYTCDGTPFHNTDNYGTGKRITSDVDEIDLNVKGCNVTNDTSSQ